MHRHTEHDTQMGHAWTLKTGQAWAHRWTDGTCFDTGDMLRHKGAGMGTQIGHAWTLRQGRHEHTDGTYLDTQGRHGYINETRLDT